MLTKNKLPRDDTLYRTCFKEMPNPEYIQDQSFTTRHCDIHVCDLQQSVGPQQSALNVMLLIPWVFSGNLITKRVKRVIDQPFRCKAIKCLMCYFFSSLT